jgi:hypothetical protein
MCPRKHLETHRNTLQNHSDTNTPTHTPCLCLSLSHKIHTLNHNTHPEECNDLAPFFDEYTTPGPVAVINPFPPSPKLSNW